MKRIAIVGAVLVASGLSACVPLLPMAGGLLLDQKDRLIGGMQAFGSDESAAISQKLAAEGYTEAEAKAVVGLLERSVLEGDDPSKPGESQTQEVVGFEEGTEGVSALVGTRAVDVRERKVVQVAADGRPLDGDCNGVRHAVTAFVGKDGKVSTVQGAWCRWSDTGKWSPVIATVVKTEPVARKPADTVKPKKSSKKKAA